MTSRYSDIARKLIADRKQVINSPGCVRENIEEHGTPKRILMDLNERYLASGFEVSTRMQYRAAESFLQHFKALYTTLVTITIALLLLFYLFLYDPQIQKLDREIKDVRMLLLLFPDEVARAVPCIVAAGKQLLADAGGSSAGEEKGQAR